MNDKIRQHLVKYHESKGYAVDDASLVETITESKAVWEGERDRHRWYTMIPTVVCVDGMYLQFNFCDVDGETFDVDDCIGGYKLDDVFEVEPKEETVTVYVPVEK